jgi:hypothetical protein
MIKTSTTNAFEYELKPVAMPTSRSAEVSRGFAAKARCRAWGNEIVREAPSAATAGTGQASSAQKIRATIRKLGIGKTLKRNGRAGPAARTKNSDPGVWARRIERAKLMQISSHKCAVSSLEDKRWEPQREEFDYARNVTMVTLCLNRCPSSHGCC